MMQRLAHLCLCISAVSSARISEESVGRFLQPEDLHQVVNISASNQSQPVFSDSKKRTDLHLEGKESMTTLTSLSVVQTKPSQYNLANQSDWSRQGPTLDRMVGILKPNEVGATLGRILSGPANKEVLDKAHKFAQDWLRMQPHSQYSSEEWDLSKTLDPNGQYVHIRRWVLIVCVVIIPLFMMVVLLIFPRGLFSGTESPSASSALAPALPSGEHQLHQPFEKPNDQESVEARLELGLQAGVVPTNSYRVGVTGTLDAAEHLSVAFERAALADPGKVAFRSVDGEISVTYGNLLTTSRALATVLTNSGIAKTNGLVGLMIARSAEGSAGMLGIILAGGAYVPLDPAYPKERIGAIIESARLELAVSIPASEHALWLRQAWPTVQCFEVVLSREAGNPAPSEESELLRLSAAHGEDNRLAYVLFTSGSTGKPKGVAGYHHGIIRRVGYWNTVFPYEDTNEETLNHITYTWVDHVMEVWNALLGGRTLVLLPDVTALVRSLDVPLPNVRRILLVPSVLRAMLDRIEATGNAVPPFLSLVMVSGEPMPATLLGRYRQMVPNGTLVNVYGMTEGHGDCTAAVYSPLRPFDAANDRVAIGSAIIDFSLCVQDVETGRWVREPGESGELYLASSCVVPGYYKHSDGTVIADEKARTKFPAVTPELGLKDASIPMGTVLFQTGDLVKWRADGELDHVGRVDDQVKVNGVRTELGDITAAAQRCGGVEAAIAVAAKDPLGETRVIVVASPELSDEQMMKELQVHLPPVYMPSSCITLSHLPELPNGKVDRKRLEAMATEALADATPNDSISRMFKSNQHSGMEPGWHYVCLGFSFVAILGFVMAHVEGADGWLNTHNKHGEHAWIHLHGLGLDLLHATSLAFFASGYIDLVAAPPKTLQASFKRVASGIAVWLLWQPIAVFLGIETSTNIWPILLLSIFRAIVWPMRLCLLNWRRAPAWSAPALIGAVAFFASLECRPFAPFGVEDVPLCFTTHKVIDDLAYVAYSNDYRKFPRLIRGPTEDVLSLLTMNIGVSLLPVYALHPLLVAHMFPHAHKPKAPLPDIGSSIRGAWSWLTHHRSVAWGFYLVAYHIVINIASNNGKFTPAMQHVINTRAFMVIFTGMQFGFYSALWHLLPARPTTLSALGHCALTVYIVYLGFLEPFALVRMGVSIRFINAPYWPLIEWAELLLIGLVLYVASSFTLGLSEELELPTYLQKVGCFGCVLPTSFRFPVLKFPCGARVFTLAWVVILGIPNVLPVPRTTL